MKPGLMVGVIIVIYLLGHASQTAVTPMSEAMDFYGHLAYVVFFAEQGRAPAPQEVSVPSWIGDLEKTLPSPDASLTGRKYRAWAALPPPERQQIRAVILDAPRACDYRTPNYQSQHPPLYYWLLSRFYLVLSPGLRLDLLVYAMGLLSICLAATALPAIYLTLRLYLDDKTALLGLLMVAWYPNLLAFLGRITNDALAFPLIAWGLYFCCTLRNTSTDANRRIIAAGLLFTAASFTKTYALTLFPVYLLSTLIAQRGLHWWRLGLASLISLVGVGSLLLFNYMTTGHFILLQQMRLTDAVPLVERLIAIGRIEPVWFFGGLLKGFWWLGYWSFVSPGVFFYAPLLFALFVLKRPYITGNESRYLALTTLWPHYLAIICFIGGMAWHAATFVVLASLTGATAHSGNEGWYANVLIGSFFVAALTLLRQRIRPPLLQRILACATGFFILWNLLARATMFAYWSGVAGLEKRLRAISWEEVFGAVTSGQMDWGSWWSLPGIIQPAWVSLGLPLLAAIILSGAAVHAILRHPTVAPRV